MIISKSWHLNDIIKKLIIVSTVPPMPPEPGIYWWSEPNTLHAPNTDGRLNDLFIYRSGKGVVVNNHNLDLDRDSQ